MEILNRLLVEWASPRVPRHLQQLLSKGLEMPMACSAIPAKKPVLVENLPEDLQYFWNAFESALLFVDVQYGQWGLRILDHETSNQRTRQFRRERPQDAVRGDRVIGEFIGDLEQLLIRGDTRHADFGTVQVALPAAPRHEFYRVADSFSSFLEKYAFYEGQKYWETQFSDRHRNPH